ncbi:MAG: EscU/YscU/HrcU family type III secretion system export apparatus switch protein [Thermodesulfobacteriota bacterium]|nr:EscU/YscU/HrcU family type III secretion system export apparatus switch protein [Thermodesulfobacteriota bacterium]
MDDVDKGKKAVAIKYDKDQGDAPLVVASGKGQIAEQIIKAAQKAGLEITQDADLTELLAKVPVGSEIPVELYQAVAEVLAFVYRVNKKQR